MVIAKNSLEGVMYDFNIQLILENNKSLFDSATPMMDNNNIPFMKILLKDIDDIHIEYRNMNEYYCYTVVGKGLKISYTTTLRESIKYISNVLINGLQE